MHASPFGREARLIGEVRADHPGRVSLVTAIGGERFPGMLEGALLPRIC